MRFGARRGRRGAGHIVAAAHLQLVDAMMSIERSLYRFPSSNDDFESNVKYAKRAIACIGYATHNMHKQLKYCYRLITSANGE